MKREFDTTRMPLDRDTVHAKRVNRTDFRGTGHPMVHPISRQFTSFYGVVYVRAQEAGVHHPPQTRIVCFSQVPW